MQITRLIVAFGLVVRVRGDLRRRSSLAAGVTADSEQDPPKRPSVPRRPAPVPKRPRTPQNPDGNDQSSMWPDLWAAHRC